MFSIYNHPVPHSLDTKKKHTITLSMEKFLMMPSLSLTFTSLLLCLSLLLYLYTKAWLNPRTIREKLRCQGINGPKPSIFYGNLLDMKRIHQEAKMVVPPEDHNEDCTSGIGIGFLGDYTRIILPHLISWRHKYGQLFQYSIGTVPVLHVTNPDIVKVVSQYTSNELVRPEFIRKARKHLFGETGIVTANGELWAFERKIIAQEFFKHRIKGMVDVIIDCAYVVTEDWSKILETEGGTAEIMVQSYLKSLSGNVISKVCFGDSHGKGDIVLSKLHELQAAGSKSSYLTAIPGARYLPTKTNREIHHLNQEIRSLIRNIVEEHKQQASPNRDLLHSIIEGSASIPDNLVSVEDFIVDNCKTIYFAGLETTAVTATWCLLLLALHPEWQNRVRNEVLAVTHGGMPDFDMLHQFKTLTMVIHETLRLFSPAFAILREARHRIQLQNLHIPKGTVIQITVPMIHCDVDVWGPDAEAFNPSRFANGVSGACKYPHMYMPFGFGPRICAGQNFAMVELKILLSLLLSRFGFELSPKYVHSPVHRLAVEPEHDLPLIVTKI